VECPGGAECVNGHCADPEAGIVAGVEEEETGPLAALDDDTGSATGSSSGSGASDPANATPPEPGCGCRTGGATSTGSTALGLLVAAGLLLLRRR
jgi:MYXO-CTERM domain-containing protein